MRVPKPPLLATTCRLRAAVCKQDAGLGQVVVHMVLAYLMIYRECLKLCVSDVTHAVFRYGQASKRPANIMAS